MHELPIVEHIVDQVDMMARESGEESVAFVTLIVGQKTGVVPRFLWDYWPDVCEGTLLEGAELQIEEEPYKVFCKSCGNVFRPDQVGLCPQCGVRKHEPLSGSKLLIKQIGFR